MAVRVREPDRAICRARLGPLWGRRVTYMPSPPEFRFLCRLRTAGPFLREREREKGGSIYIGVRASAAPATTRLSTSAMGCKVCREEAYKRVDGKMRGK